MDVDRILEQTQWDFFWAPTDATVVDRAEVQYVSCPRDIVYLNTATRLRATADALPRVIAEVNRAHAGVRSRFMVVPCVRSALVLSTFESAGYAPGDEHVACAVAVGEYDRTPPENVVVRAVDNAARLHDWHRVVALAFGDGHEATDADLRQELRDCTGPGTRVHRVVAYDAKSGEPLSAGGLTLFPALGFGLLWAGGTVPHARGRGAYTSVVRARVAYARESGLSHVGLYARTTTSAPIVQRQGFRAYGEMVFWVRGASVP